MKNFFNKLIIISLGLFVMLPGLVLAQEEITNPSNDGSDPFGFGAQLDNVAGPYSPQTSKPLEEKIVKL